MSRYLGPIVKKSKRLNFSILETDKEFKRKNVRQTFRKKRKTDYALQLNEKQKLRFRYFLPEKQLRNTFLKVLKMPGIKNENLLITIERRLDNIVYRLGLATTRREARQLVNHNHILLNNKKASIPSMLVQVGDIVSLKTLKFKKSSLFAERFKIRKKFSFLELDEKNFSGKLQNSPKIDELETDINTGLVVEYYNLFI
ncbi:MAG: 30S ribosomal protein S4 [Mollicutes bacterium]|nr:MAG: 30S ribosomal protein S4 [Mollicutes bacterium]